MSQGLPGHHADPHAVLRERAQQVRRQALAQGAAEGDDAWPVASPCVSVCRLDPERLGCEGCLRTLDEIRAWKTMDNAQRLNVWRLIEDRLNTVTETPAP